MFSVESSVHYGPWTAAEIEESNNQGQSIQEDHGFEDSPVVHDEVEISGVNSDDTGKLLVIIFCMYPYPMQSRPVTYSFTKYFFFPLLTLR